MKSIQWRLVFIYLTLVLIVMISSGTFIVWQIRDHEYNKIHNELKNTADSIRQNIVSEDGSINPRWREINTWVGDRSIFINKKIYILDPKGNIIIPDIEENGQEQWNKRVVYETIINKKPSVGNPVQILEGGLVQEYVDYAYPILSENEIKNIIFIRASTQETSNSIAIITNIIVIASFLALFVTMIFGIYFAKTLTEPIKILTKKAKEMAEGHLDNKIEVKSNDEIGQLTGSFNHMAEELNQMLLTIFGEKNKLETVITHMADGILAFDRKGMLIHANPAAYEMLDMIEEENYFYDIFKRNGIELIFNDFLTMKPDYIRQHLMLVKDKYINGCFATYGRKKGESDGVIIVLQDVTEQKELDEMRKEFVANVSHELRTPLTTVKSYAETLLDGAIEDKNLAVSFLQVINNEADRMTALVQDLLELSRLDNKQVKFNFKSVNITQLIIKSVEQHQILAQKKNQKLDYSISNKKIVVNIDSERIQQVLSNVISNAIKYSPENAEINVKLYEEDDFALVSVSDTGFGIPESDLPRIFERFYRVDKARSRKMGGTGLGLAIAKEIMELHNGKIYAESEYGNGTTITLKFPKQSL